MTRCVACTLFSPARNSSEKKLGRVHSEKMVETSTAAATTISTLRTVVHHTLAGPLCAGGRGGGAARRPRGSDSAGAGDEPLAGSSGNAPGGAVTEGSRGGRSSAPVSNVHTAKSSSSSSCRAYSLASASSGSSSQVRSVSSAMIRASVRFGSLARILTHSAQKGNFAGMGLIPSAKRGCGLIGAYGHTPLRAGFAPPRTRPGL